MNVRALIFLKAATFEKLFLLQDIKLSWQASFQQQGQFKVGLTPPRHRIEPDSLAAPAYRTDFTFTNEVTPQ